MTDVLVSRARRNKRMLSFFCAGFVAATRENFTEIERRVASYPRGSLRYTSAYISCSALAAMFAAGLTACPFRAA